MPSIRVEAEDDLGQVGHESIEIATGVHLSSKRVADGSDADAVDAWRRAACWAPS